MTPATGPAPSGPRRHDVGGGAASGTVRYWAAAREAAGTDSEPFTAADLAELIDAAVNARGGARGGGGPLAAVLARSSFLIDGDPVGMRAHAEVELSSGAVVEVLPPFAGG